MVENSYQRTLQRVATMHKPPSAAAGDRIEFIDILRGFVIIIMMLDHVRDYFHVAAFTGSPTDPATTTSALFATRWITHLCAPTFVFLAGVSTWIQQSRGHEGLSAYLVRRGIWLIVLEISIIAFALNFAPFLLLQVIWAIGFGMIVLAALVRVPRNIVLGLGIAILALQPITMLVPPSYFGDPDFVPQLWRLFFGLGPLPAGIGIVAYPAIPWLSVMLLGYGLGPLLASDNRCARNIVMVAAAMLGLALLLRAINLYGDQAPWSPQDDALRTLFSFLNLSKYPPSLIFVLTMLGVSLLLSLPFARVKGIARRLLLAYGRAPLFVFIVHFYIIHTCALIVGIAIGVPASAFIGMIADPSGLVAAGWGFELEIVYGVWGLLIVGLYPAACWFAELKRRSSAWWLRYL